MTKKKLKEKILDLLLDFINTCSKSDDKRIIQQARQDIRTVETESDG